MNIILFEDKKWNQFLPLVYTRAVGELRTGMLTTRERFSLIFKTKVYNETRKMLEPLYEAKPTEVSLHINARLIPNDAVLQAIRSLPLNESLISNGVTIAYHSVKANDIIKENEYNCEVRFIEKITDIFSLNGEMQKFDLDLLIEGKSSSVLHESNTVIGDQSKLFVAAGAKVYASTLNTIEGPIYIAEDAEVMEGSHIRGPFYLGEHSALKMGTKIYGATSIGPHCKVGGEVSNSVLQGYSNKAHDGFIGNTILGEWCNLGADTNTSNLKNNYSQVRHYNYATNTFTDTGLTFCGLILGDHSKCGINTMFNTGTVAGVCANIYGGDFPPKHIPSFSWGGADGFEEYDFLKALETIRKVMSRRSLELNTEMIAILKDIFQSTAVHRENATQSQN